MLGWIEFIAALAGFMAAHIVPIRWRGTLTARFGRGAYLLGFSLLSLALLYWLVMAAGRAPVISLWPQAQWMRWLVNIVMPLAFVLAVTNGRTGIISGFSLWAAAHLVANGDLAHVILFGLMLGYALAGLIKTGAGLRRQVSLLGVAGGLGLWAVTWYAHYAVIGVTPLP